MDITIGIQNVARELTLESDQSAKELSAIVSKALANTAEGAVLELTSSKGRTVVVPVASVGYVAFGGEEQRPVGFGTL